MDFSVTEQQQFAALIARVFLGLLFVMQGYDAVFRIKIRNVIDTYDDQFARSGIPRYMTVAGAWYTSLSELIGGGLLIAGLFQYYALYALGLNLLLAAFAFGAHTPVWDTKHVFPRLAILIFLMVIPPSWNGISLDNIIQ